MGPVANCEPGARAPLSRRRVLQIGAGAAFSAPTVTSLATTPAYAACGTGLDQNLELDDFSLPQIGGTGIVSDGSFHSTDRHLSLSGTVSGGYLTVMPGPGLVAWIERHDPYDFFIHCPVLVLKGVETGASSPTRTRMSIQEPFGTPVHVFGVPTSVGNGVWDITYDFSGVSPALLVNITDIKLRNQGSDTLTSSGPLVAQGV